MTGFADAQPFLRPLMGVLVTDESVAVNFGRPHRSEGEVFVKRPLDFGVLAPLVRNQAPQYVEICSILRNHHPNALR